MPYLTPKSGKTANWLPSQVVYGVDCSDSDPAKWVAFGKVADELAASKARPAPTPITKTP